MLYEVITLETALRGLARMRLAEGRVLERDLRMRIGLLEEDVNAIRKLAPGVAASYRDNLVRRLGEAGSYNFV